MKFLGLFFALGFILSAPLVFADSHGTGLPDPLGGRDFIAILREIVRYLILAAIPITAAMIIIGGYQMMFGGGDVEKIKTGRRTILYAVIGFVIIILAWSIIAIIQNILGVSVGGS